MRGIEEYWLPYILSQAVSLILLWVAWKKKGWARFLFALLFLYAGCYNLYIGLTKPDEYNNFARLAIPLYRDFIEGWFSTYNYIMIPLIALGQLLIGIGFLLKGWWLRMACMGAIIFLVAIAPLMVGSAFPFSITVSLAAWLILRNRAGQAYWFWEKGAAIKSRQYA